MCQDLLKLCAFFYLSSNDLLIALVLFFLVQANALIVDKKTYFIALRASDSLIYLISYLDFDFPNESCIWSTS